MTAFANQIEILKGSNLFDASWYAAQYPDVGVVGIPPADHYLRFGARLLRDPCPSFSTREYLEANPDVAAAGVNALVHYLEYGLRESRPLSRHTARPEPQAQAVDVVVPVFNALEDVQKCLEAVRTRTDGYAVRCLVVNDGSNDETTRWLREYCGQNAGTFHLTEHPENLGYTRAVNTGLRASTAPYVITLNSDTIVTEGWLRGMVRCMHADPAIGIVGPLSNAASWQNVPALYDTSGNFAVNDLPAGLTPDAMARVVAAASRRAYPRAPFVNGFCFMIRRAVIDALGYMDEESFPLGYGEENDYCMRAADAGFTLAIADDTFVFHAKSKSFGHERRKELSRQGSDALKRKHTAEKFNSLVKEVKKTEPLDRVRQAVVEALRRAAAPAPSIDPLSIRILFLLPVRGGGGGAHSVVQEVAEMRRMGLHAHVGVLQEHIDNFLLLYGDVPNAAEVFVGFELQSLQDVADGYDIVVATIFSSAQLVKKIVEVSPYIMPAYYAQDYEPLFFEPGSSNHQIAHDSYTLVDNAVVFAKTHWIAREIQTRHGVDVRKVEPSIDHEVYKPFVKTNDGRIHVAAMIRPQTPRRGAERTMRVLSRLAAAHPGKVAFHLFGCAEATPHFEALHREFEYRNYGVLKRPEVAALLGRADVFIDLSDYQAFGRTALEAMACACAAVVPIHGGADEYAVDRGNAVIVDSLNEDQCFERLDALVANPSELRRMQLAGLATAARYSVHTAAVSEMALFAPALARHRQAHPTYSKGRLCLLPATQKDGQAPTSSAWVRVLLPYRSTAVRQRFEAVSHLQSQLPHPIAGGIAILQRDCPSKTLAEMDEWLASWRAVRGRLFYEIDDDLLVPEALTQRGYTGDAHALAERVRWFASHADLVTASTQPLADKLAKLNPNVAVVPNRLDPELWRLSRERDHTAGPYARTNDGVIRIGYIGTPTHDHDMDLVADAMRRIESEFGSKVVIEVVGAFQNRKPTFGTKVSLPKKNDYLNFVRWLHERVHWDIGIIPLAADEFNRSKSSLKFLEYAALDMAIVCSDVESYRDVAEDGVNSLVVPNKTSAWFAAVKKLIDEPALRVTLASCARRKTRQEYSIDDSAAPYLRVLGASPHQ